MPNYISKTKKSLELKCHVEQGIIVVKTSKEILRQAQDDIEILRQAQDDSF